MSQEIEQNQMDQFERLMELSFLREKRKQMKQLLQQDENSIQRLINSDSEQKIKSQRKRQLIVFDELKFKSSSQILEEQQKAKQQKIRKIVIYITLIIMTLVAIWFYFSK
jgi:3-phosphoglycerate kinase